MSVLKEKLGEDGYAELVALMQPEVSQLKDWLRGALNSWTVWAGTVMVALPEIIPMIGPELEALLTPDAYRRAMQVLGIMVILLRVKTTTSLKDRA
jgi:hypothetical protein